MTATRLIALVTAACGGAASSPQPHPTAMVDPAEPRTPYAVELTLRAEPASPGRVRLRIAAHGGDAVTILAPERPDQVELIDPDARRLAEPTLRVAFAAWRRDRAGLADDSRPSTAQRATRLVTLAPGDAHDALVELAGALDGDARGWCARAWLVGAAHPVPSNVICWPAA